MFNIIFLQITNIYRKKSTQPSVRDYILIHTRNNNTIIIITSSCTSISNRKTPSKVGFHSDGNIITIIDDVVSFLFRDEPSEILSTMIMKY